MLKIKLSRTGKRNQPQYRIVVNEAKTRRDGKVTDSIGYYNPLTEPATVKVDRKKYDDWLSKGAQPTQTVKLLVEKPATKAKAAPKKKAKKAATK